MGIRSDVDLEHEFLPNDDGVYPCLCGAYPILVEAEGTHGAMGYVCLNCPACMRPRKARKGKSAEQIALEAWNAATKNEHRLAGYFAEGGVIRGHDHWKAVEHD